MHTRIRRTHAALIVLSAALAGCSDDEKKRSDVDAGADASTGGGPGADAGSGGTASGGSSGAGGSGGSEDGGGTRIDAGADADAGDDLSDLPAVTGKLVAAAADFAAGQTEISTVDLDSASRIGNFTVNDSDAVPVASGGRAFVLERTNGILHVLDANGASVHAVDLRATGSEPGDAGTDGGGLAVDSGVADAGAATDAGTADASTGDANTGDADSGAPLPPPVNPHDVVVVSPASGPARAYVSLYDADAIAVVDLESGAVLRRIDLSAFVDGSDADGHAEVDAGYFDAVTGRVYFTLHRLDLTTGTMDTNYSPVCSPVKSLLIGIDPATDTVVDINGAAPGDAVELSLAGPAAVSYVSDGGRLLLVNNGCFQADPNGGGRARHGIEAVVLATGETSVLYAPSVPDFLGGLLPISDDTLIVTGFDALFSPQYQPWQVGDGALGAPLSGVPDAPVSDTPESLIGVRFTFLASGSRADLVRYRIANGATVALLEDLWDGDYGFVSGMVRVTP